MPPAIVGALLLGAVIGYLLHFLVRRDPNPGIKDLSGIVAALLGGAVMKVLAGADEVSWYLIGLGAGFFLYWLALMIGREQLKAVKGPPGQTLQPRNLTLFPFLK